MATAARIEPSLLTLDEYILTSYRPDCDFVDGYLEERILGTPKHAYLQMKLGAWFGAREKEWNIVVMGDVRTRVGINRVRLPDVAILVKESADFDAPLLQTPPLIAIEILSPEDRLNRVTIRLGDFLTMGVPFIWLIDPVKRAAYTYTAAGLQPANTQRLTLPNSPIYLDLPELFAALD